MRRTLDREQSHAASPELRPYFLQAEGAPIDLVITPGATGTPRVVAAGDEAQLRTACASGS